MAANAGVPLHVVQSIVGHEIAVGALLLAGDGTEDPKLLGLVFPRDRVDLVPLRVYGVKHTHIQFPMPWYTKKPPREERLLKAIHGDSGHVVSCVAFSP